MTDRCDPIREDLIAFLDGELSPSQGQVIQGHLRSCATCQRERQALEGVWDALDLLPGLEARPGWLREVETSVIGAPKGQVLRFPRLVFLAAAAALLVGAALYLFLGGDGLEEKTPRQITNKKSAPRVGPEDKTPERIPNPNPPEKTGDEDPDTQPNDETPERRPTPPDEVPPKKIEERTVAQAELFKGMSKEERDLVENLEVLERMGEIEEVDLVENIETLEDLDEDEVEEG